MTTIKFSAYSDQFFVRCNLSEASAPVEQSADGSEWGSSPYMCADTRHTTSGLVEVGKKLAARAFEVPIADLECDWEELDCGGQRPKGWIRKVTR